MSAQEPQSAMVETTIDGRSVRVLRDTWALAAARRLGIRIPTLCDHPALEPYGACRLCVVEVTRGKSSWLTTSCDLPIREGLSIRTDTPAVLASRRMTLELLWSAAPGADEIVALAREMGVERPRFPARSDAENRCILCGLCVRACRRMGAGEAIAFTRRGAERTVDSPFGDESAQCIGCNSCVAVCPTGHVRSLDRAGKRRLGTWHTEMEMDRCEDCGTAFVPGRQLRRMREQLPAHVEVGRICPACRRARAAAGWPAGLAPHAQRPEPPVSGGGDTECPTK